MLTLKPMLLAEYHQRSTMDTIINTRIIFLITTAFCSISYATNSEGVSSLLGESCPGGSCLGVYVRGLPEGFVRFSVQFPVQFVQPLAKASADTYLGCYNEYGTEAVFAIPSLNGSTPDECRERCRKDTIYSFAGLWGGTHCFCASGLDEERITPVNNSLCYLACPGKPTKFCGGSNVSYIFSVYSVCARGLYGSNCTNNCNCKDSTSCTVYGLCPGNTCAVGWRLNRSVTNKESCSIDVDECKADCNSTNASLTNCHRCGLEHQCRNTRGSYTCICNKGFEIDTKEFCKDINECEKQIDNCSVSAQCINTKGSYRCEDIDECATNTTDCEQHTCINMDGGYYCDCQSGYELHYNGHSCIDFDECQTPCSSLNTTKCYQCNQSYECQNMIGSYTCSCKNGYIIVNTEQDTCAVAEGRGWWLLEAGFGLGSVVLIIFIVVLAITVCKFLARRNTANASHTSGNEMDRMSSMNSRGSGPKKFTKAVKQQAEFDDVYFEII